MTFPHRTIAYRAFIPDGMFGAICPLFSTDCPHTYGVRWLVREHLFATKSFSPNGLKWAEDTTQDCLSDILGDSAAIGGGMVRRGTFIQYSKSTAILTINS
ncbi:MAG: hypothetical protein J5730_01115 [Bacteroidales bacterium]|nr:hypothetical protein [Bacteroidales bacterium]